MGNENQNKKGVEMKECLLIQNAGDAECEEIQVGNHISLLLFKIINDGLKLQGKAIIKADYVQNYGGAE